MLVFKEITLHFRKHKNISVLCADKISSFSSVYLKADLIK